jgi:rod shape-determining protein MreC
MEAMPQEIKVHRGDTVWTTAYSFAPPDIPIGTVQRIRRVKKNASQTLLLRPASPFRSLRHVYIVENAMFEERQRLEDSTATQARAQERKR